MKNIIQVIEKRIKNAELFLLRKADKEIEKAFGHKKNKIVCKNKIKKANKERSLRLTR